MTISNRKEEPSKCKQLRNRSKLFLYVRLELSQYSVSTKVG